MFNQRGSLKGYCVVYCRVADHGPAPVAFTALTRQKYIVLAANAGETVTFLAVSPVLLNAVVAKVLDNETCTS